MAGITVLPPTGEPLAGGVRVTMSDNRPSVYFDNETGNWVYRASSVGMCVKALTAIGSGQYDEALGQEKVDLLDRTAKEGNLHEGAVLDALVSDHGYIIREQQTVVDIPVAKGVVIRGHTDGIISKGPRGKKRLVEVKSMSTKVYANWLNHGFEAFPKYAYQITAYMQAHPEMDVVYACKRREDGMLNITDIKAGESPVSWLAVKKKVLTAEAHRKSGRLPNTCDVSASQAFMCGFWYLHDEEPVTADNSPTVEMMEVLADLMPKRLELSAIEQAGKDAETERKTLDKELLNLMGSTKTLKGIRVGEVDYQVTRVEVTRKGTTCPKCGEQISAGSKSVYPKVTEQKTKGSKESNEVDE